MFCYRSAEKKCLAGDFFFFLKISEKCLIFTNFPHFVRTTRGNTRTTRGSTRTTRESTQATRESAWTTCRATCHFHITCEFGLKSKKKVWVEKKAKKMFLGALR